jgi:hypothetical protein
MASAQTTTPALIIEDTGQTFPLDQGLITIGRKSGNTIALVDDLKTSRHHATIAWEAGQYIIQDRGSSNGTYVNDRKLTGPQPLRDGDTVRIGDTLFSVHLPAGDLDATMVRPAPGRDPVTAAESLPETEPRGPEVKLSPFFNPYVGPRTFTRQESDRFYGREREARELFSLIISQRLVLFYAQSGAGKSSLINTRLVPELQEAGYAVLPIGRVSGELPEGVGEVENIFLFNLFLSLDESDGDPNRFTHMALADFLTRLTSLDGQHYYYDDSLETEVEDESYAQTPYVLLVDQFEEIVTTHPERWQDREGFFQQLDQAMAKDPYLWVVLTLREDYVAPLEPYTHLIPGKLRAQFYMQRMSYEAALEAISRPAERFSRPFAPGVVENLVDNLRQIRVYGVQDTDQSETQPGQFVEPVQLQVVCYQLWENLKGRPPGEIKQADLEELGDVDMALAQFYEQALQDAVAQTDVSQIDLRNWFEIKLITEARTRGTVYRGRTQTEGIDNPVVDLLVNKFLLRSEVRTGGTWYELVHDRFVDPILQANQEWRLQQPLIQMAQTWDKSGRSPDALLEGQQLKQALVTNWRGLGPLVEAFLEASQAAEQEREEALRRQELAQAQALADEQAKRAEVQTEANARLRRRAVLLIGLTVIAVLMALIAGVLGVQARRSANVALTEQAKAIAAQGTAEEERAAAAANAAAAGTVFANQGATQTAVAGDKEVNAVALAATSTALANEAASIDATLTAAAVVQDTATAIPTDTPVPTVTDTPTGVYVAAATVPPTATATATPMPTVDQTATAEVEAAHTRQAELSIQQSAVAATQTLEAGCDLEPGNEFREKWVMYQDRLGCPTNQVAGGQFAEQAFENGMMFWSQILEQFFVAVGGNQGTWYTVNQDQLKSNNPDGPGCEPPTAVPKDRLQPIRGFGAIWCDFPDIREDIGWATEQEHGVGEARFQPYENGAMLRSNNGIYYISWGDRYIRER